MTWHDILYTLILVPKKNAAKSKKPNTACQANLRSKLSKNKKEELKNADTESRCGT